MRDDILTLILLVTENILCWFFTISILPTNLFSGA